MELWFDDGRKEIYDVAYPILKKHNMTGILALVYNWIGKEGFMTVDNIKELIEDGWKIASHSMNHDDLTEVGEFAFDDMFGSTWLLKELFKVYPIAFVFPYNKSTPEIKQLAINIIGAVRKPDVPHFHCDGWYVDKETIRIRHAQDLSRSKYELEQFNKLFDSLRRR